MSRRDEFIQKLKEQLDALNVQLEKLEGDAERLSGEAKQKAQEQLSQLREMAEPASQKLQELRSAGEAHWDSASAEAEKVYKAFVHSYNYFKSQL